MGQLVCLPKWRAFTCPSGLAGPELLVVAISPFASGKNAKIPLLLAGFDAFWQAGHPVSLTLSQSQRTGTLPQERFKKKNL